MKFILSIIFGFLPLILLAQHDWLEVKINHITFSDTTFVYNFYRDSASDKTDTVTERKFVVSYHLKNTADKTVRFYFNDIALNNVAFKVYQENKLIAAFLTKENDHNTLKYYLGAPPATETVEDDSIKHDPEEDVLRNSLFTLSPGQQWEFTQTLYWNKNQPNRKMNNQGYVDPGFPHYLALVVNLRKYYPHFVGLEDDFKKVKAEMDKIMNDDTFLGGYFTSEKVVIDFD